MFGKLKDQATRICNQKWGFLFKEFRM